MRIYYSDEKGLKKVIDKLGSEVIDWKYKKQNREYKQAEIKVKD